MKPLPVLTEEDWCIWLRLRGGQFDSWNDDRWLEVIDAYEASDRRDAELMLFAAKARCGLYHWTATRGQVAVLQGSTGEWIEIGGMLPAAGDITNCV
jgi:hypothetical protein